MLEKYLEKKIIIKAKKLGYLTYKFTSPSNRGVPDRIFISESGKLFFMEFKSKKGKLSELQKLKISELVEKKQLVFVIDDEELAMKIIHKYMSEE